MDDPSTLCIPLKLDAFVFNQPVCNSTESEKCKIAPITQPNYTFMRVRESLALNDILPQVDLHNAAPASTNPRLVDLGTGKVRSNRLGVYLHWMVPRPFRTGLARTESASSDQEQPQKDHSAPVFPAIPNRWMIVRRINLDTVLPKGAKIEPSKAWIIESDRVRYIDDISTDVDLQVDVSPFITAFHGIDHPENIRIDEQAEVFIGQCFDARTWTEVSDEQRVQLTAASSSNQLFTDYQYHCGNVFSMLDTLTYTDANNVDQTLQAADVNYYVLGWQQDPSKDLMSLTADGSNTRRARLAKINAVLNEAVPSVDPIKNWLDSNDSGHSICHGALYDVHWSSSSVPDRTPADEFAAILANGLNLAVGTSPMDSILTYVSQREERNDIEQDIWQLRAYLRAEDETVDGSLAAQDEIQNFDFAFFDGGYQYDFLDDKTTNAGWRPKDSEIKDMRLLNSMRRLYDCVLRRLDELRWSLFSVWWKYVSDVDTQSPDGGKRINLYRSDVQRFQKEFDDLEFLSDQLCAQVSKQIGDENLCKPGTKPDDQNLKVKQAAMTPFSQQSDPTLMVSGLRNAWPRDFNDSLNVRLDNQLITGTIGDDILGQIYFDRVTLKPDTTKATAKKLLAEFLELVDAKDPENPPAGPVIPLYHDKTYQFSAIGSENPWRDRWAARQPWFPLYLEWEAQYFHIPFDYWIMQDTNGRTSYSLKQSVANIPEICKDNRTLSGRMLILPQPAFSLEIHIQRLLKTIPDEINKVLPPDELNRLRESLEKLDFLSAPMAGFTRHLTTLYEGTHVKPNVRVPGLKPIPLQDASQALDKLQLKISEIDKETDPTPYGTLQALLGQPTLGFKPVTHGQFRFTKLNVIDKFGQTAHAINPLIDASNPIWPSTSDYYKTYPVTDKDKTPNVVDPDPARFHEGISEFVQVPPCINQPARWNADFIKAADIDESVDDRKWRAVSPWENPIWGWMVVNYVDQGIQFFTAEGQFFREVRMTQGTNSDVEWLPFKPPAPEDVGDLKQLKFFIQKVVQNQQYLKELMRMITSFIDQSGTAPSAYGQFLNSLVGKPLALVNMGWWLELSTDSRKNQSTLDDQLDFAKPANRPRGLLPDDAPEQYLFSLKLGDRIKAHDGLVGYFQSKGLPSDDQDDLEFGNIYTHYGLEDDDDDTSKSELQYLKAIDKKSYPPFKATWFNPTTLDSKLDLKERVRQYEDKRNSYITAFGAIMDPFRPIHGYSSILPLRPLSLPPWTWEGALKQITTFFHAGPMLLPTKLPDFNPANELTGIADLNDKIVSGVEMELPALQVADWAWLQPYSDNAAPSTQDNDDPKYMPIAVKKADMIPKLNQGPYTATDGYMLLRAPIEKKEPPNPVTP